MPTAEEICAAGGAYGVVNQDDPLTSPGGSPGHFHYVHVPEELGKEVTPGYFEFVAGGGAHRHVLWLSRAEVDSLMHGGSTTVKTSTPLDISGGHAIRVELAAVRNAC